MLLTGLVRAGRRKMVEEGLPEPLTLEGAFVKHLDKVPVIGCFDLLFCHIISPSS
jgi:hypothetical protein